MALERKSYVSIWGDKLYLNFFIFLVAKPGIGKTRAIDQARKVLHQVATEGRIIHLAPNKVTKEKFVQIISTCAKTDFTVEEWPFSALAVMADELSVFLAPGDKDLQNLLTELYDCPAHWSYKTVSRTPTEIDNAYVTMIGGITPSMIGQIFNAQSIGAGFTSRILFIYSDDKRKTSPFKLSTNPDSSHLVEDLKKIHEIRGGFELTEEAVSFAQKWYDDDMPPIPRDSRFDAYNERRFAHWMKLGAVISAGRRDSKLVNLEDLQYAKELMLEAEEVMPLAFEQLGQNPMLIAMRSVHRWMMIEYNTNGKQPIHEQRIRHKLLVDVAPNYLEATVQSLLTSGTIVHVTGTYPNRSFAPVPKTDKD